jgi:hypothetical protein
MFLWYAVVGALLIVFTSFLRKQDLYPQVCVATGLVAASVMSIPAASWLGTLHPLTLDGQLYWIDQRLGLDGFTLARWAYSTSWVRNLLTVTYDGLPLACAVVWTFGNPRPVMLRSMVWGALAAYATFNIFPAVGPSHAFAGFPFGTPPTHAAAWTLIDQNVPRDCLPSMHFGWALFLFWNCRHRLLKALMALFLFLTALATVGRGEHYFIDLIVAVPFCVVVQIVLEKGWISALAQEFFNTKTQTELAREE